MNNLKTGKKDILLLGVVLFTVLVCADQVTKHVINVNSDTLYINPISIIPGYLNLVAVRNTGAAWGIFHGNNIILLVVAIVALVIFTIFFKAITEWYFERVLGFFMILSGIVGNSLDRIFKGFVVDFIDFYIKTWHWPAFNIADSAICIGVTTIILSTIFRVGTQGGTHN